MKLKQWLEANKDSRMFLFKINKEGKKEFIRRIPGNKESRIVTTYEGEKSEKIKPYLDGKFVEVQGFEDLIIEPPKEENNQNPFDGIDEHKVVKEMRLKVSKPKKVKKVYLLKYKTNFCKEGKFKVFSSSEKANQFHTDYKQIKNSSDIVIFPLKKIIHQEVLVLDLDIQPKGLIDDLYRVGK